MALFADFLGEEVVQRHMNGAGRASLLRRIQAASKNDMELDHALKAYGASHSCHKLYIPSWFPHSVAAALGSCGSALMLTRGW